MAGSRAPSTRSTKSNSSRNPNPSDEQTPLLSGNGDDALPSYADRDAIENSSPAAQPSQSLQDDDEAQSKGGPRWATIIALSTLCALILAILGLGFAAPAVVHEYANQAVVFEPTNLSIDSFTSTGVRARVQGTFALDASRVHNIAVRDLGKAGTFIARQLETGESDVRVYLPAYDNLQLGTARIPPIKVNIRNGHTNHIDFVTDLEPGDVEGIRKIANDWLDGRLGQLEVKGTASLDIRSGIFKLGSQTISQSMVFEGQSLSGT